MPSSQSKQVLQALKDAVGEEYVTGNIDGYAVDGVEPGLVLRPPDLDHLSCAMATATEHRAAIAPRGGGTRLEVGNPPERLDAVVDVSNLNGIVQHNPADLTVTVQAGMTLASLRRTLGDQGQFLGIDPPLPDRATIGGTLASGAAGPLRWHYGHPRDSVIGMKVVQADGTVTKSGGQVVKNVSGYDMSRLHIGGLGTLGIIAEVSFKLTPLPQDQATVVGVFDSADAALAAGLGVFQSPFTPLAMTAFDARVKERAQLDAPDASHLLAVRLGGRPRTLKRQVSDCVSICREHGANDVDEIDDTAATALWRSLADFGWDEKTAPVALARASVLPGSVSGVLNALEGPGTGTLRHAAVVQPGFGSLQIAWYPDDADASADDITRTLTSTREATHRAGGRLLVERCPLDVKSRLDVWDEAGESLAIMRRMKDEFDPLRLLNPGRFVGGI